MAVLRVFSQQNNPFPSLTIMKTKFRFGFAILSLFVGVASASASELVTVNSSRNLRVVVLDGSKADATRASVHEAFAASLAASIQRQGTPLAVKLSDGTDASTVAGELKARTYDAAL